jgi:hypothetical protein
MFSCAYTNPIIHHNNVAYNTLAAAGEGKILTVDAAANG